ncbi:hypothetical protein D3C74_438310 [compost metagenome]
MDCAVGIDPDIVFVRAVIPEDITAVGSDERIVEIHVADFPHDSIPVFGFIGEGFAEGYYIIKGLRRFSNK